MDKRKYYQKRVFFTSFILTLIIFSVGLALSYLLDYARIDTVFTMLEENELNTEAYFVEEEFAETFNADKCPSMRSRIYEIKREITKVAQDLSNYGSKSIFKKKDFDYLKRRYFLLELRFYNLINDLNEKCGSSYIPILFFYEIDDDLSTRQGYVLDDLSQTDEYKSRIITLSFDKDYEDEPSLEILLLKFNVTKAPTIIINNEIKDEGITYGGQINGSIIKILREVSTDPHARDYNFSYVLDSVSINKEDYIKNLTGLLSKNISYFSKGDISLMLGRLTKNDSLICSSLKYYFNHSPRSLEEKAILYETIASIDCKTNKRQFLLEASDIWKKLGNDFRSDLDKSLAYGNKVNFKFWDYKLKQPDTEEKINASKILMGSSYFRLDDSDTIVSQADRVTRDWLSYQLEESPFSENVLEIFSEKLYWSDSDHFPSIGWHEGGRIRELKETGLSHEVASGTIVKKIDGRWYAPNEEGVFMFDVPIDKIQYPTTRFLKEDIALIVDSHGMNMLVEQAVRNNATITIGCCDHIGKVKAIQYLSDKGIRSICFTDKYLPLLLNTNTSALGSPTIKLAGDSAIVGNQPITIDTDEKIIAMDVEDITLVQSYYDTPARYFRNLEKLVDLNVIYFHISGVNQTGNIVESAIKNGVRVIGTRVYEADDYYKLKEWLGRSQKNRAILFHSTSYPYGYRIMKEFPLQTTFDDINPVFI